MGDFAASDLWGVSYVAATQSTPCQGCGGRIDAEDRCYAAGEDIWHANCWPHRGGVLRRMKIAANQWKPPQEGS